MWGAVLELSKVILTKTDMLKDVMVMTLGEFMRSRGVLPGVHSEPGLHSASGHRSKAAKRAASKQLLRALDAQDRREVAVMYEYRRLVDEGVISPPVDIPEDQEIQDLLSGVDPERECVQARIRLLRKRMDRKNRTS